MVVPIGSRIHDRRARGWWLPRDLPVNSWIPDTTGIGSQNTFAWPWAWNGQDAITPSADGEDDLIAHSEPVYRVRVRGTTELELAWEIMQPNEECDHFSTAVRRRVGLVRMSADERNDRDLRLVYGSALDRLLADNALRARIGKEVAGLNLHDSLNDKGKEAIESLDARMASAALPSDLKLGLTTSQGLSIGALIGLMATKNGVEYRADGEFSGMGRHCGPG